MLNRNVNTKSSNEKDMVWDTDLRFAVIEVVFNVLVSVIRALV